MGFSGDFCHILKIISEYWLFFSPGLSSLSCGSSRSAKAACVALSLLPRQPSSQRNLRGKHCASLFSSCLLIAAPDALLSWALACSKRLSDLPLRMPILLLAPVKGQHRQGVVHVGG